jgi:aspartyl protease family protein
MREDFLEPDRGSGVVGWAIRQLAMWLVAGIVVYEVASSYGLVSTREPAPRAPAQAGVEQSDSAPAVDPANNRPALGQAVPPAINSLALRARDDGHVVVTAFVNDVPVRFLIDTGATTVALTPQDATRAGVAGNLNYSVAIATANGMSRAAPVTLRGIRISTLEVDDVNAEVMQAQGGISLLGQSFLNRLRSYQMSDGVLTLTWQQ